MARFVPELETSQNPCATWGWRLKQIYGDYQDQAIKQRTTIKSGGGAFSGALSKLFGADE